MVAIKTKRFLVCDIWLLILQVMLNFRFSHNLKYIHRSNSCVADESTYGLKKGPQCRVYFTPHEGPGYQTEIESTVLS